VYVFVCMCIYLVYVFVCSCEHRYSFSTILRCCTWLSGMVCLCMCLVGVFVSVCVCSRVCLCSCVSVFLCVWERETPTDRQFLARTGSINTFTRTHTHTHTHTRTQTQTCVHTLLLNRKKHSRTNGRKKWKNKFLVFCAAQKKTFPHKRAQRVKNLCMSIQ